MGTKVVSDWRQHRDEAVAPICQRKNTEPVEGVLSVGYGGKKPVEVFLVDALGEEGDHSKEVTRNRVEATECRGGQREFQGFCKALIVVCLKHLRPLCVPLLCQSIRIPPVVSCVRNVLKIPLFSPNLS